MFRSYLLAATAFALAPTAALADSITLNAPMQGASLHEGSIDMVVYYLDHDDHFEVVATYAAKTGNTEPNRLRMALTDGDASKFSVPGHRHVIYAFSRENDTVHVSADLVGHKSAENRQKPN